MKFVLRMNIKHEIAFRFTLKCIFPSFGNDMSFLKRIEVGLTIECTYKKKKGVGPLSEFC